MNFVKEKSLDFVDVQANLIQLFVLNTRFTDNELMFPRSINCNS